MAEFDVLTLEEAKQALNVTATTKHDAELPLYITAVSDRLDRLVGPVVQRSVSSELHSGGHESIFLHLYPVVSVGSVQEYKEEETTATVLTAETNASRPAEAYLTHPYRRGALLSSRLVRRSDKGLSRKGKFAKGQNNIVVSYVAGRCADTASVEPLFKQAAGLMLQNFWRAQQDSTGNVGEFDVPQSYFPRWAIPQAVRQLLEEEMQQPRQLIA